MHPPRQSPKEESGQIEVNQQAEPYSPKIDISFNKKKSDSNLNSNIGVINQDNSKFEALEPAPQANELPNEPIPESPIESSEEEPEQSETGNNQGPKIGKLFHLKRKSKTALKLTTNAKSELKTSTATTVNLGPNSDDKPLKLWPIKKELIVNIFDNIGKPVITLQIDPRYWPKDLQTPETIHNMDYEKTCELKQGFVAMGEKVTLPNGKIGLKLRPVFGVLNKHTLSFFDAENVNSLREGMETDSLFDSPETKFLDKVNCFQLMFKPRPPNLKPTEGKVLCADTKDAYNAWINALKTFHKCEVSEYSATAEDAGSIKVTTKRVVDEGENNIATDEEMNTKFFTSQEEENDEKEKEEMEEELRKIQEAMECQRKADEGKVIRIEEEKKRLQRKTRLMHERAECIEEALKAKAFEEEELAEGLFKEEESQKRKSMFKNTREQIKKEQREAKERLSNVKLRLVEAEKEIQEQVKKSLITEVLNFQKILDPSECYNERLKGGNDAQIKRVCGNLLEPGSAPDIKLLINCMNTKHFCQICCNHNIGEAYEDKRLKCKSKCLGIVYSKDNADNNWLISYNSDQAKMEKLNRPADDIVADKEIDAEKKELNYNPVKLGNIGKINSLVGISSE